MASYETILVEKKDAVTLVTFGTGHYRMLDMFVPGAIISVCWVVLITGLMMLIGPWLGLL